MKIVFFGSSKHVIPVIEVLRKNFNLSLVLSTENPKDDLASQVASQGHALRSYPVIKYCIENKISYLSIQQFNLPRHKAGNSTTSNVADAIQQLKKFNAPVGVLADFGLIIPNEILNLFPHGIINIHPSLLPKYRGPTPVQTAILNGDKITGATIIKLDEQVDHGPILAQVEKPIFENDTSESLYDRLFKLGAGSIVSTIELYLKGKIKFREQNHTKATFTKHLTRQDGHIDLENPPAKEIFDRMIRAYYPWPGVWTRIGIRNNESGIRDKIVKFLPGRKIQVEGKKPMSYKDFINGYPEAGKIIEKLT